MTDFDVSWDDANVIDLMNEDMPDSTAGHASLQLFFGLGFAYLMLSAFTGLMSDGAYMACHLFLIMFTIGYVVYSGLYSSWKGKDRMAWSRRFVSVVFALQVFYCVSFASCVFLEVGDIADKIAKRFMVNEWESTLGKEYREEKGKISAPRKEYFESERFRRECSDLFDRFDKYHTGYLDAPALKPFLVREFGHTFESECLALAALFSESGDSLISREDFKNLVQYVSLRRFKWATKEGAFPEGAAWEVLQLDPREATIEDVRSAYEELALKYDPARRANVPERERERDIQEIIDAKHVLEEKFAMEEDDSEVAIEEDSVDGKC